MTLFNDLRMIRERDPAAKNWLEVLFCYPGFQVLLFHRVAHFLHQLNLPLLPRLVAQLGRFLTGIEIHPGARIGRGVFIDHGMGVVIGETAIVGDYTVIYQGVTLGGTGKETGKRHPTLGKNVVVGAGAKVLGNIYIGDNVRIGAASVVLRDVPSDCTIVGIPGRIRRRSSRAIDALGHDDLRDVEAEVIQLLFERLKSLEYQIKQLSEQLEASPTRIDVQHAANGTLPPYSSNLPTQSEVASGRVELSQRERDLIIEEFLDGAGI